MSEGGEKTEDPTPKRLDDARKKGQVAKSTEVVMTFSSAMVLITAYATFPYIKLWLDDLFLAIFRSIADEKDASLACLHLATKILFLSVIPIALASIVSVIFANVAQFGFLFSFESLKPEFTKLNPIEGLKKMFSKKTLFEFLKSIIKILILGTAITWAIKLFIGQLTFFPFEGIYGLLRSMSHIFIFFCAVVLLLWIILSGVDFLMQKHFYKKEMMMTKDEVKREFKESEGNPEIKQTRKGIHRELIFDDTVASTKQSTVVVTNPTHYATAIYYSKEETPLPVILAKGVGPKALQMKSVAYAENIPVIENVALARALHEKTKVKDVVPFDLLEPIAEILRWVALLPKANKRPL